MNKFLKQLAEYIIYFSPSLLSNSILKYGKQRKLRSDLIRSKRIKISKEELSELFDKMNLNTDVFLHCSLTNPGKILGGTKYVTELICKHTQISKHTLLVSALPFWGRTKDYLEAEPVFDVRTAPIAMGAVNEYIALMPKAVRSLQPTHSVVAIGPNAIEYTNKHHLDATPFSYNSPYYRLLENKGKILMFGVGLNNVTFLHVIEDMLDVLYPVKVYMDKVYNVKVVSKTGSTMQVPTKCHKPLIGIRRDCERLRPYLLKIGAIKTFQLGESELSILDVQKTMLAYCDMMLDGMTIYGKYHLTRQLKEVIKEYRNKYSI